MIKHEESQPHLEQLLAEYIALTSTPDQLQGLIGATIYLTAL